MSLAEFWVSRKGDFLLFRSAMKPSPFYEPISVDYDWAGRYFLFDFTRNKTFELVESGFLGNSIGNSIDKKERAINESESIKEINENKYQNKATIQVALISNTGKYLVSK